MKIATTAAPSSKPTGAVGKVALAPHRTGRDLWLEGSDFTEAEEVKPQACILLAGAPGMGKTTFVTRFAPGPVAFINFDGRAAHAVKDARENYGRRIIFTRIDFPANITKLGDDKARIVGQAAVDKTIKNLEFAVRENQKGNVRTIALDTGTEYAELLHVAITGRVDRVKGDYGKSKGIENREWWKIFNLVRESTAHFVLLSRAKAIWANGEPTGKFTYRGPEVMDDGVDWAGQIRLRKGKIGSKKVAKEFEIEVTKAGVSIAELGEVYTQDDWEDVGPFVFANLMNYPGTSTEDWEG